MGQVRQYKCAIITVYGALRTGGVIKNNPNDRQDQGLSLREVIMVNKRSVRTIITFSTTCTVHTVIYIYVYDHCLLSVRTNNDIVILLFRYDTCTGSTGIG